MDGLHTHVRLPAGEGGGYQRPVLCPHGLVLHLPDGHIVILVGLRYWDQLLVAGQGGERLPIGSVLKMQVLLHIFLGKLLDYIVRPLDLNIFFNCLCLNIR